MTALAALTILVVGAITRIGDTRITRPARRFGSDAGVAYGAVTWAARRTFPVAAAASGTVACNGRMTSHADTRSRLVEKVVTVTGGSSGIGAAVARLKYQIPAILAAGGGAIVNNASLGGVRGIAGLAPYVAAKHGVVGLTRSAALEFADRGVRVNALVTANVDTPLYRRLLGASPDEPLPDAPNPTGRVASADEIAAYVAYLLSDEAAFVTGAALAIDGGATA